MENLASCYYFTLTLSRFPPQLGFALALPFPTSHGCEAVLPCSGAAVESLAFISQLWLKSLPLNVFSCTITVFCFLLHFSLGHVSNSF